MNGSMVMFLVFAAFCLAGAYGVAFARSPLVGAAWLLLALFGVAGLFAQAGAHFLAAMQVLVYVGATAVLFVFVIMLLNLTERELGIPNVGVTEAGGLLLILALLVAISMVATRVGPGWWGEAPAGDPGSTKAMGGTLLGGFVGAFEIISVLLLASMGGAVMLTKRAHGAADAIASIQRTRAKIDKRTRLAFAPDASLPDQQGPPANQQPASADDPPVGVKKNVYGPGETL